MPVEMNKKKPKNVCTIPTRYASSVTIATESFLFYPLLLLYHLCAVICRYLFLCLLFVAGTPTHTWPIWAAYQFARDLLQLHLCCCPDLPTYNTLKSSKSLSVQVNKQTNAGLQSMLRKIVACLLKILLTANISLSSIHLSLTTSFSSSCSCQVRTNCTQRVGSRLAQKFHIYLWEL